MWRAGYDGLKYVCKYVHKAFAISPAKGGVILFPFNMGYT